MTKRKAKMEDFVVVEPSLPFEIEPEDQRRLSSIDVDNHQKKKIPNTFTELDAQWKGLEVSTQVAPASEKNTTRSKPKRAAQDAQEKARIVATPPAELLETISNLRRELRNSLIERDRLLSKIRAQQLDFLRQRESDLLSSMPKKREEQDVPKKRTAKSKEGRGRK